MLRFLYTASSAIHFLIMNSSFHDYEIQDTYTCIPSYIIENQTILDYIVLYDIMLCYILLGYISYIMIMSCYVVV